MRYFITKLYCKKRTLTICYILIFLWFNVKFQYLGILYRIFVIDVSVRAFRMVLRKGMIINRFQFSSYRPVLDPLNRFLTYLLLL